MKKRVHELAKELNIESKDIINRLGQWGVVVKSHMSTLDDHQVKMLLDYYRPQAKVARPSQGAKEPVKGNRVSGTAGGESPAAESPRPAQGQVVSTRGPAARVPRGPGLVDRVPQRPPDRRFEERPFFEQFRLRAGAPAQPPATQAQAKPAPAPPPKPVETKPATAARPPVQPATPARPPAQQAGPPGRERGARQGQATAATPREAPRKFPREGRGRGLAIPPPRVDEKLRPGEKPKTGREAARPVKDRDVPRILREDRREERYERLTGLERRLAERTRPVSVVEPVERKPIVIGERITVQELAQKMHKGAAEVIKRLMMLGVMVTINQEIDADTAAVVASEFGYEVQVKPEVDLEALLAQEPEEDPSLLEPRPSVVTVMGHVDHGKTSLLDAIRQTNVTATEAGGITQHIGAYQVEHAGKKITFIDTPGHEAFAAMRARGAKVTDIAVLVVAADDGVMPQTVEAINHCRAANVPIIVAINKIDKPDANPERVKQQLTEHGLVPEEWGGDTICVPVSAVRGDGLPELLEMILLVAEMMDLKANPHRPARGTVIEAELDKGRGPVATVLVQTGTLEVGNAVVAGAAYGRVRAMMDHQGRRLKKAGPSVPVEVLGLSEVPQAGDAFYVVQDERFARQVAMRRQLKRREEELKATTGRTTLDEFLKQGAAGQVKELPIIIKGDVHGTVEALRVALERLGTDEVRVNVIHSGVGAITETDIMLASASRAIIFGFNVRPDVNARRAAEAERVDIRLYRVIYDVVNDVKAALSGLLEPEYREVFLGRAEVRKIFKVSKVGTIAGCYVHEGKVTRDAKVRLVRDGVVVYEGKIDSLKRFKDDVREVSQGFECGLALEKFNDIQEGDIIEAYTIETVKRELA